MIKPNRTSVSCEKIILWRKHFFAEVNPVQVVLRGKKGMLYILWIRIFFFWIIPLDLTSESSVFYVFYLFFRHFFNVRVCICVYVRSKRATTCSQIQSINFEWFRLFRVSVYRFNLFEMPFNHSQSAFDVNYWRECLKSLQRKIDRISSRKLWLYFV